MFEGLGDQSFHTTSSAAASSPFRTEQLQSVVNEVAAEDEIDEEEEEYWSDVSV